MDMSLPATISWEVEKHCRLGGGTDLSLVSLGGEKIKS